ncbi:MAG: nucleotidyltransferase domain-containing protein [Bacteroidetes bacterium SW_9_63_38]|nr:MAG: nucleotidyltransferase domain-containing protein [Bacteroidetes bacterium SW_9_63_38]
MLSDEVADRLRAVFAAHSAVRAAYVFGSVAAGGEWNESDLDLAVVVDGEKWSSSSKVPLIGDCMEAARRDWIDLVVLNDAPLVLQFEAVRPNVLLYQHEEFKHGTFYSTVLRKYWDFKSHLRRQRKAYKRRLMEENRDG